MRRELLRLVTFLILFIPLLILAQQPPKVPSDFKAEVLPSLTEVKLTWKDNSTDEDGFRIMRSNNNITWTQIAILPSNTTEFMDKDLLPKTTYYYRIHAYNAYGRSDNVSLEVFTALLPVQPTNVKVEIVSGGIKISWKDSSNYETNYIIERRIDDGDWQEIAVLPENTTELIDYDIPKEGTYSYRIYAENEIAKSKASEIASITVTFSKLKTALLIMDGGLAVYNLSDPSVPILLALVEMKNAQNVFRYGNYAYVANGESGITIVDITYPEFSAKVGSYDTPGFAYSVYVKDNIAYVADGEKGLVIIDVSNVQKPNQLSIIDTPGLACGIYVQDNYAYIADEKNGLVTIDITDPKKPKQVGMIDTPGLARGVYVEDKYAYVTDGEKGLAIIDVSNPAKPTIISQPDTQGTAYNVFVYNKYAYVADGNGGIAVFDVSNSAKPVQVGLYITYDARSVYVQREYVYIADVKNGLVVVKANKIGNLYQVGRYDTAGYAYNVYVQGNYAYVADYNNGLVIIDISNPKSPVQVGRYYTAGNAPAYAEGV
ncbi:MAG TPA: fibronectin type III domain-containing protein, partial [Fervidobacterium sp.]|nr:fibronectin type III domain-containing protein [Fervidobacterium sp.]